MRLIVLTGVASYPKTQIAQQIKAREPQTIIIDNGEHLAFDGADICLESLGGGLADVLGGVDTALLIAAESINPEHLLALLDSLHDDYDDLHITTIAVIDDRTCACFPHLEDMLRGYADVTLEPPFDLDALWEDVLWTT